MLGRKLLVRGTSVQIEVWSDIVCPWCYIGKRRLERALEGFEHADEVEVVWRSFQLDPAFPRGVSEPVLDSLAAKTNATPDQVRAMTARVGEIAAQEGLHYEFDGAVMVNTFDAHRLTHLARERGVGGQAHERLMRAQLVEARDLGEVETLVELAVEIGLDAAEARTVLTGDAYTAEVEDDVRTARALGATGVPFFVMDRAFGVSGAQPLEVFTSALEKAHARRA